MWRVFSSLDKQPPVKYPLEYAPQPILEVSVYISISGVSYLLNGSPIPLSQVAYPPLLTGDEMVIKLS